MLYAKKATLYQNLRYRLTSYRSKINWKIKGFIWWSEKNYLISKSTSYQVTLYQGTTVIVLMWKCFLNVYFRVNIHNTLAIFQLFFLYGIALLFLLDTSDGKSQSSQILITTYFTHLSGGIDLSDKKIPTFLGGTSK